MHVFLLQSDFEHHSGKSLQHQNTQEPQCTLSLSTDSKPQELGHLEHLLKMLGLFYSITTPREIFAAQDASRIAGCSCLQAPSVNK